MWFRIKQILISFDQFLNTLIFGGWADETMSSALWRMDRDGRFWGWLRPIIDTVLFFDPNHCQTSYESELLRNQSPPEERK